MKQNDMRLISVVMKEETANIRNSETSEMLDYGFSQYNLEVVLKKDSILGKKQVNNGEERYASIVPISDVTFLNKKMDEKINATYKVKVKDIQAPVKVNDVVGTLYVYNGNKLLKEVPLTVNENIKRANIFKIYLRNLLDIISGDIET